MHSHRANADAGELKFFPLEISRCCCCWLLMLHFVVHVNFEIQLEEVRRPICLCVNYHQIFILKLIKI